MSKLTARAVRRKLRAEASLNGPLLANQQVESFGDRRQQIQARLVGSAQRAVEQPYALVADLMHPTRQPARPPGQLHEESDRRLGHTAGAPVRLDAPRAAGA